VPLDVSSAAIERDEKKLSPLAPAADRLALSRAPKPTQQIVQASEPKSDAVQSEGSTDKAQAQGRAPLDSPKPAPKAALREPQTKPAPLAAPRNIPQPAKLEPINAAKAADVKLAPPEGGREADKLRLAEASPALPVKMAEVKTAPLVTGKPPVAKLGEPSRSSEDKKPLAVQSPAKVESVLMESKPVAVPATPPKAERAKDKSAGEQIALLPNKPAEAAPPKPIVARTVSKPLEGFIIQLAFNDKAKAQRWAEKMEKRGYAVSVTEAGSEGALRVRLGNFAARDDAERQLRTIKQEGLNGIILNLPQAFRPETRSSIP
jgi:DedD protein